MIWYQIIGSVLGILLLLWLLFKIVKKSENDLIDILYKRNEISDDTYVKYFNKYIDKDEN